jgi:5-methylcytosine-specific restriction endonuclease McrA
MPIDRSLYPPNWDEISKAVKDETGWCCEGSPAFPNCHIAHGQPHPVTGSIVVLTVAHLDHNPAHNERANLRAWCQRCHNTYDRTHRIKNARRTRARKRKQMYLKAGQRWLGI